MKNSNWDLTICNRADLLCDWEFMDKKKLQFQLDEIEVKLNRGKRLWLSADVMEIYKKERDKILKLIEEQND